MAFADKQDASKYVYQYTKDNYDRVSILLPKGDKSQIQALLINGQSLNAWINEAIQEKLEQEKNNSRKD